MYKENFIEKRKIKLKVTGVVPLVLLNLGPSLSKGEQKSVTVV